MISPNDEDTLSDLPPVGASPLRVSDSGAATSVGLVRPANEDHFGSIDRLFVVADGMGGAAGGALASQLTVEFLLGADPAEGWIAALSTVNDRVRRQCSAEGFETAGSTVVGLVVEDQRCVTLAMGDSRIYRLRAGGLHQLTTDHNLGNLRLEEGLDPTKGDDRGKPRALTSYVGNPDHSQRIDVGTVSAQGGDRMVLTSDGVHEQVDGKSLVALLSTGSCQEAAEAVVGAADRAGGRDNATAFVIELATEYIIAGDPSSSDDA